MSISVMVDTIPIEDILATTYWTTISTSWYVYWIVIKSKINWTLDKINILYPSTSWTLIIWKWTKWNVYTWQVQYNVTSWWEFTLPTPYQIEKDSSYVIMVWWSTTVWATAYYSWYPKEWTNVIFTHSTTNNWWSEITNILYAIWSVTTTQTS